MKLLKKKNKLTTSKRGVSRSPAAQVELTKSWDHLKLGSPHSYSFQGFVVPICITQDSQVIVIMTLQVATFQYFCVCFVQLSLHSLLLLLPLLIPACDSLSLFVSLPHYTLDWAVHVFVLIAATSFSGLICFVSASANMQSVSTRPCRRPWRHCCWVEYQLPLAHR